MTAVTETLRRAEALFGSRLGVRCGEVGYTYRQLAGRVRRLAAMLERRGVGHGDRVAVLMANCHRYLESYFAVPGLGAVLVPVGNRLSAAEVRYLLEDAGPTALIADPGNAPRITELATAVTATLVTGDDYENELATTSEREFSDCGEDELAALFYTGGTTGAAKGVMLSHRNLLANAMQLSCELQYTAADIYLHCAPMFHLADGASTYAVTWAGGGHVIVPGFEPAAVLTAIGGCRVTAAMWVPTMIRMLLDHPALPSADLSSLRLVLHGAAPIAPELCRQAVAAFGCSFYQAYGMTEAAPVLTILANEEELLDGPLVSSAGREVRGVQVTVRHPDGRMCAPGKVGEVVARGANIMRGYWRKPAETSAVLRDGWYWTGDLGYLEAGGYLYIVDRAKDMIITGGENVYSVEVENALQEHPAVHSAAVIAIPHPHWGEAVHATVVCHPGHQLTLGELTAWCKARIAGYKAPRSLDVVDELPVSAAGKVLKSALRERYWAGEQRGVH